MLCVLSHVKSWDSWPRTVWNWLRNYWVKFFRLSSKNRSWLLQADLNAHKWKLLSICVLEYRCATTTGTATVKPAGPLLSVTPKAMGAAWTVALHTMASGCEGWGLAGAGCSRAAHVVVNFGACLCAGFHSFSARGVALLSRDAGVGIWTGLVQVISATLEQRSSLYPGWEGKPQ